eukprot:8031135-Alexandrium_andersonii.AAC.1
MYCLWRSSAPLLPHAGPACASAMCTSGRRTWTVGASTKHCFAPGRARPTCTVGYERAQRSHARVCIVLQVNSARGLH